MIRKTHIIIALLFLLAAKSFAFNISEHTKFSLLTCDPGTELYSLFGHSALRMVDRENNVDVVFNYGLFSFETEYFFFKFIIGYTDYLLGVQKYSNFVNEYLHDQRTVVEQNLNLSVVQKEKLFTDLQENLKEENRVYRYNYFTNNCATKLRDLVENTDKGNLSWACSDGGLSYRDLIKEYIAPFPWVKVGTDLALGIPADRKLGFNDYMFLPDYLSDGFGIAVLQGHSLVLSTQQIVEGRKRPELKVGLFHPAIVFGMLFVVVLILTYFEHKGAVRLRYFDFALFFLIGQGGLLVWFLSFFSVHPTVFPNVHVLWLNAVHVIVSFFLLSNKHRNWVDLYLRLNGWLIVGVILLNILQVQSYVWSIVLLQLAVLMRSRMSYITTVFKRLVVR